VAEHLIIQGRPLSGADLQHLRQWLGDHPDWSRWRLSRELATCWDWRNGVGQLKDMAARTLLGKLAQRGLIALPARRQVPTNRMRCGGPPAVEPAWDQRQLDCALAQLGSLTVEEISTQPEPRAWARAALDRFHYLGFGGAVGDYAQMPIMRSWASSFRFKCGKTAPTTAGSPAVTLHNQRCSRKSSSLSGG